MKHEQWFDEAQAWNIAKLSLPEIIERLPYEQHPILWFLVLKMFQTFGLQYDFIWIVSYIFTNMAILFILFKIDIDQNVKLMICFFGPLIYFYPVLSREYCLMPILFFILAYLNDKKIKYSYLYSITLVLLANTMVLVEMFVFILGLQFIYELIKNKVHPLKIILNFLILSFGALIVIIPIFHGLQFLPTHLEKDTITMINYAIQNAFLYFFILLITYKILKPINKKNKLLAYTSILYIVIFLVFIYQLTQEQKIYIIFFIIIYIYMISTYKERKKMNSSFLLLMYILGGLGLLFSFKDISLNFSDSEQVAEIINDTDDAVFISVHPLYNVTMSNFEDKLLNCKLERELILYDHSKEIEQLDYQEFKNIAKQLENKDVYLIYDSRFPIKDLVKEDFEVFYQNPNTITEPILVLKYKK